MMRGNSGDWIAAKPNMPIVEGDSVYVGVGARTEIQLAYGNFLRLGGGADVEFLELGTQTFRVRVRAGTAIYSELPDRAADVDIETPLAAIRPTQQGRYIVTVLETATHISIPKGRADVAFRLTSHTLKSGRTMVVREGSNEAEFEVQRGVPAFDLATWAAARDKEVLGTISYTYVSRDIYGASRLDQYGTWRYIPTVGHSWFPTVTTSWTPYRHGDWIWLAHYGWTWVGAEPWGWAPYHWGRWYRHVTYGWGWFPGAPRLRHVWRPALVAFFGIHRPYRSPIWDGFGGIGWCPLAPGEIYRPWWGYRPAGRGRPQTIVVDNSVRIENHYRNAREQGAVSYLQAAQFGLGGRQAPRALRSSKTGSPVVIRGPVPIVPNRASQGRLLQANSPSQTAGTALRALRRGTPRTSRDGAGPIRFDTQRDRIQASVDQFQKSYRPPSGVPTAGEALGAAAGSAGTPSALRATRAATVSDQRRGGFEAGNRSPAGRATTIRADRAGSPPLATTSVRSARTNTPAARSATQAEARAGSIDRRASESRTGSFVRPRTGTRATGVTRPTETGGAMVPARTSPQPTARRPTQRQRAPSPVPRPGSGASIYSGRSRTGTATDGSGSVFVPRNGSRVGGQSTSSRTRVNRGAASRLERTGTSIDPRSGTTRPTRTRSGAARSGTPRQPTVRRPTSHTPSSRSRPESGTSIYGGSRRTGSTASNSSVRTSRRVNAGRRSTSFPRPNSRAGASARPDSGGASARRSSPSVGPGSRSRVRSRSIPSSRPRPSTAPSAGRSRPPYSSPGAGRIYSRPTAGSRPSSRGSYGGMHGTRSGRVGSSSSRSPQAGGSSRRGSGSPSSQGGSRR